MSVFLALLCSINIFFRSYNFDLEIWNHQIQNVQFHFTCFSFLLKSMKKDEERRKREYKYTYEDDNKEKEHWLLTGQLSPFHNPFLHNDLNFSPPAHFYIFIVRIRSLWLWFSLSFEATKEHHLEATHSHAHLGVFKFNQFLYASFWAFNRIAMKCKNFCCGNIFFSTFNQTFFRRRGGC